jgi:hypothetical protein
MARPQEGVLQLWRTATPNNPPDPNSLPEGYLSLEMNDPMRVWMGVPISIDPTGRRLLYDATQSGGGGGGGSTVTVGDTPPISPAHGDLWFDSFGLQLYIFYRDPTSAQWISVTNQGGGMTPAAVNSSIAVATAPLEARIARLEELLGRSTDGV